MDSFRDRTGSSSYADRGSATATENPILNWVCSAVTGFSIEAANVTLSTAMRIATIAAGSICSCLTTSKATSSGA